VDAVEPDVKRAALDHYLERARLKSFIAFGQWRYLKPGVNRQQVKDNIKAVSAAWCRGLDISKTVCSFTARAANLPFEFEQKYDLQLRDPSLIEKQPWLIHTFWSLGMADPFPDESTIVETLNQYISAEPFSLGTPVYPRGRMNPAQSPVTLYIPSRYLMIKMIRACLDCHNPYDLWFN